MMAERMLTLWPEESSLIDPCKARSALPATLLITYSYELVNAPSARIGYALEACVYVASHTLAMHSIAAYTDG